MSDGIMERGLRKAPLPRDGSKPMTGDLDLDGNDVLNAGNLNLSAVVSASGTLANSSTLDVTAWTAVHDPNGWVAGGGVLTLPTAGVYVLTANVQVGTGAGPSNVTRLLARLRQGSTVLAAHDANMGRHNPSVSLSAVAHFSAPVSINMQVFQTSGESKPGSTFEVGVTRLYAT